MVGQLECYTVAAALWIKYGVSAWAVGAGDYILGKDAPLVQLLVKGPGRPVQRDVVRGPQ